jgi:hypothetical protein
MPATTTTATVDQKLIVARRWLARDMRTCGAAGRAGWGESGSGSRVQRTRCGCAATSGPGRACGAPLAVPAPRPAAPRCRRFRTRRARRAPPPNNACGAAGARAHLQPLQVALYPLERLLMACVVAVEPALAAAHRGGAAVSAYLTRRGAPHARAPRAAAARATARRCPPAPASAAAPRYTSPQTGSIRARGAAGARGRAAPRRGGCWGGWGRRISGRPSAWGVAGDAGVAWRAGGRGEGAGPGRARSLSEKSKAPGKRPVPHPPAAPISRRPQPTATRTGAAPAPRTAPTAATARAHGAAWRRRAGAARAAPRAASPRRGAGACRRAHAGDGGRL